MKIKELFKDKLAKVIGHEKKTDRTIEGPETIVM